MRREGCLKIFKEIVENDMKVEIITGPACFCRSCLRDWGHDQEYIKKAVGQVEEQREDKTTKELSEKPRSDVSG